MKEYYSLSDEWINKTDDFWELFCNFANKIESKKILYSDNFDKKIINLSDYEIPISFADFIQNEIDSKTNKNGIKFYVKSNQLQKVELLGSRFSRDNGKTWELEYDIYEIL